jgi:hypothetical protein
MGRGQGLGLVAHPEWRDPARPHCAILAGMGVRPGVPDFTLVLPNTDKAAFDNQNFIQLINAKPRPHLGAAP